MGNLVWGGQGCEPNGSGVFLRSSDIKKTLAALEIQVHESADSSKYGMVGALYDAKPTSKNMAKPVGQWNHLTITCRDSLISVVLDGEEVLAADLNDWPEAEIKPRRHAEQVPRRLEGLRAQRADWFPRPAWKGSGAGVVSQYQD